MSGSQRRGVVARRLVVVAGAVVLALIVGGCGPGDPGDSDAAELARQVDELDAVLRESITRIGLDPDTARRAVDPNSCWGVDGQGRNIEFYFDEPSRDRALVFLRRLEAHWSTGRYELNSPPEGEADYVWMTAVTGPLSLGGSWFPASKELAVGGSTACV
jgi:hypothetical protein